MRKRANREPAAVMCRGWNVSVGDAVAGLAGLLNLTVLKWHQGLTKKVF